MFLEYKSKNYPPFCDFLNQLTVAALQCCSSLRSLPHTLIYFYIYIYIYIVNFQLLVN